MIVFISYNDIMREDLEIGLFYLSLDGGALANINFIHVVFIIGSFPPFNISQYTVI